MQFSLGKLMVGSTAVGTYFGLVLGYPELYAYLSAYLLMAMSAVFVFGSLVPFAEASFVKVGNGQTDQGSAPVPQNVPDETDSNGLAKDDNRTLNFSRWFNKAHNLVWLALVVTVLVLLCQKGLQVHDLFQTELKFSLAVLICTFACTIVATLLFFPVLLFLVWRSPRSSWAKNKMIVALFRLLMRSAVTIVLLFMLV